MPAPYAVRAGDLFVDHIGESIRFQTIDEVRDITAVITAELRQISHDGATTTIRYGEMAEREQSLSHDHPIVVHPVADYSDHLKFTGKA